MVASCCISALIAEGVLRYLRARNAPISPRLFYQFDPLLGWRKVPNREGWLVKRGEYRVYEKINSKGLRGPECPYSKPPGEFRILVLGDSFVEGYSVCLNDLLTRRLSYALNARNDGRTFRVINGGTGGYSTDQELLFFEHEGKKYGPDLVILVFCDNDVWYNNRSRYWRGYKPLFKLQHHQLVLTNVPVPKPHTLPTPAPKPKKRLTLKQWLNKNSCLYFLLRRELKKIGWLNRLAIKLGLAHKPARPAPKSKPPLPSRTKPPPDEFRVWQKTQPPRIRSAWRITEALLARLNEAVTSAGARLLVFYVPNRAAIYEDAMRATKQLYGLHDGEWDLDKVGKDLQAVCTRLQIPCINPTQRFRLEALRLQRSGRRLYYRHDAHWNAEGHRLAAQILCEYIEKKILSARPNTHRPSPLLPGRSSHPAPSPGSNQPQPTGPAQPGP